VEVWDIQAGEMVQKIPGRHLLLNSPEPGERVIALSDTGSIVDLALV
jgi:hypothetical protein